MVDARIALGVRTIGDFYNEAQDRALARKKAEKELEGSASLKDLAEESYWKKVMGAPLSEQENRLAEGYDRTKQGYYFDSTLGTLVQKPSMFGGGGGPSYPSKPMGALYDGTLGMEGIPPMSESELDSPAPGPAPFPAPPVGMAVTDPMAAHMKAREAQKTAIGGGTADWIKQTPWYQKEVASAQIKADLDKTKKEQAPLPRNVVDAQNTLLDDIRIAEGSAADLAGLRKMIDDGSIDLGLTKNLMNEAKNFMGSSSPESRNYSSFMATLERMRNDSLRLNKGVQTEGDAQRAWNELFKSANDPNLVKQRLDEIEKINKRAAGLKQVQIDAMRAEYGKDPLDVGSFKDQETPFGSAPKTREQLMEELRQLESQIGGAR